ncbi:ubiquinone biosynthesis accessory factor UbiJ [Thiomicrorhabdus heinhorstiae]|uniref:Ubiquinone biosynthesis accessory factor UbiJ n=1 Tax=Thiomicrorhabdus heinhorstiae TaxID=2748010 RepID=A0ABS0BVW0_9GAMM|nr:SCP2 sterol-binding domain-containing protein [Thiomicrorhabdus heinhorstiae]MBF6057963.1 SCP2 sterol-binding domain-containing protein [Thiomicrorhabdus heinhorstiae]
MATVEVIRSALNGALETLVNHLLAMEENSDLDLQPLQEQIISLQICPLQTPLFLIFNDRNIILQHHLQGEADATLECDLTDFLNQDAATLQRNCKMTGNSATAEAFLRTLAQIEFDWEEHLSHYTGDLIAFKIGHGLRSFQSDQRKRRQDVRQTVKEYLQFEINLLPTESQIRNWSGKVDETSERIDALEQRLNALISAANTPPAEQ